MTPEREAQMRDAFYKLLSDPSNSLDPESVWLTRASAATVAEPSEKIESLETHVAMLKGANRGLLEVLRRKESADIEAMVNRFLGWKLPNDFMPDFGVSFDRAYADKWGMPSGTNLFTADQARAMFKHVVSDAAQQQAEPGADERAAFEEYRSHLAEGFRPGPHSIAFDDFCAGYRAAQSGQRAGVAKPHLSLNDAMRDVFIERVRQQLEEGWTPAHDDAHTQMEMAEAAAVYALAAAGWTYWPYEKFWPWDASWWKPTTPRRNLIKAGALILAEIERLDRAAAPTQQQEIGK